MASAVPDPPERACQYWLDVPRPIQPRAPRDRLAPLRTQRRADDAPASRQMELHMSPPAPRAVASAPAARPQAPDPAPVRQVPPRVETAASVEPAAPSFVRWLLAQHKAGGAIGELAKAARLDRDFPKEGSADTVRARFAKAGADGDAYAALDDAERAYDRLV